MSANRPTATKIASRSGTIAGTGDSLKSRWIFTAPTIRIAMQKSAVAELLQLTEFVVVVTHFLPNPNTVFLFIKDLDRVVLVSHGPESRIAV